MLLAWGLTACSRNRSHSSMVPRVNIAGKLAAGWYSMVRLWKRHLPVQASPPARIYEPPRPALLVLAHETTYRWRPEFGGTRANELRRRQAEIV